MRLQSAIEYLTTYGWAILILAIVLSALFSLGVFKANNYTPSECLISSGFTCGSYALGSDGSFSLNLQQSTSTPINITSFGCAQNGTTSNTVMRKPLNPPSNQIFLPVGGNVTIVMNCYTGNGIFTGSIGTQFAGTLIVNYTNDFTNVPNVALGKVVAKVAASKVTTTSTVSSTTTTTTQTSSTSTSILTSTSSSTSTTTSTSTSSTTTTTNVYSVPLTLTNGQAGATPAPFQQMLTINSQAYQSYINSGWTNVEFTSGNYAAGTPGTTYNAWVESNPSNAVTNTIVWIKLPSSIAGNSQTTIYMDFMSSNVMSASGPTGEAPQLSASYGQYDNGNVVFSFYDNFNGVSLNGAWTTTKNGGTVTVNNGITLTVPTSTYAFISTPTQTYPKVAEAYMASSTGPYPTLGLSTTSSSNPCVELYSGYSVYWDGTTDGSGVGIVRADAGGCYTDASNAAPHSFPAGVWQMVWPATGQESATLGGTTMASTDSVASISNYKMYLGSSDGFTSGSTVVKWARMRAYPPNGVMPGQKGGGFNTVIQSVPIILSNSQSSATPAPFQQMITINSKTYQSYINSGWTNVEFTTGNYAAGSPGTTLQAWVESNPSNTVSNTVVWVKLPSAIAGNGQTTIYMDFMSSNVMSGGGPTGEAPQLSTSYGQYDNGALVFNYYDNFAGTTLDSNWNPSSYTYTINNGVVVDPTGSYGKLGYSGTLPTVPYIMDTYVNPNLQSADSEFYYVGGDDINSAYVQLNHAADNYYILINYAGGDYYGGNGESFTNFGNWNVFSFAVAGSDATQFSAYTNYDPSTTVIGPGPYGTYTFNADGIAFAGIGPFTYKWVRWRSYPPNGVMPSASAALPLSSVPVTLTNSQSGATPAPFQQMITVNSLKFKAYINSGWTNVEFTTGNYAAGSPGTVLQAWVESNPSNTVPNTIVWVKLPNSIAGNNGHTTIYMDFMNGNVMSASGPTGEAPQLSPGYGQYDNGASVFKVYDNFFGSDLDYTKWWTSGSVTINNGAQLDSSGGAIWFQSPPTIPFALDAYVLPASSGSDLYDTYDLFTTDGVPLPICATQRRPRPKLLRRQHI